MAGRNPLKSLAKTTALVVRLTNRIVRVKAQLVEHHSSADAGQGSWRQYRDSGWSGTIVVSLSALFRYDDGRSS